MRQQMLDGDCGGTDHVLQVVNHQQQALCPEMGVQLGTRVAAGGAIVAEAWMQVGLVNRLDPLILAAACRGDAMSASVGMIVRGVYVPPRTLRGLTYNAILTPGAITGNVALPIRVTAAYAF